MNIIKYLGGSVQAVFPAFTQPVVFDYYLPNVSPLKTP